MCAIAHEPLHNRMMEVKRLEEGEGPSGWLPEAAVDFLNCMNCSRGGKNWATYHILGPNTIVICV